MDTKNALNILIQAVLKANKTGAFELSESKLIADAVEVFTKQPDGTNTTTPQEEEKGSSVHKQSEETTS